MSFYEIYFRKSFLTSPQFVDKIKHNKKNKKKLLKSAHYKYFVYVYVRDIFLKAFVDDIYMFYIQEAVDLPSLMLF